MWLLPHKVEVGLRSPLGSALDPKTEHKTSKIEHKTVKNEQKYVFATCPGLTKLQNPPKSFGNWHRQRSKSIRFTAAPEKKTIQGISGRAARKRAIQGGARVPDFATLQTGKKHGILYIAAFS